MKGSTVPSALLAILVLAVAGCSNPFASCKEERQVVEEIWNQWGIYPMGRKTFEDQGWTCEYEGAIRNAFGQAIGQRYVCTICR